MDFLGWLVTIILFLFGLRVLDWVTNEKMFRPNFPGHDKTKVPITQRRR